MASLQPDLLLEVAELADLDTVSALMCTSKATHNVISSYEISIVKAKLRNFRPLTIQPTLLGKGHAYDKVRAKCKRQHNQQQLVAANGSVLTSATPARETAGPYSFAVIQELNLREARYRALFAPGAPLERAVRAASIFQGNGPNETEVATLISRLTIACRLADRLGDCVADVMRNWTVPHAMIGTGFTEDNMDLHLHAGIVTKYYQQVRARDVDASSQTGGPEGPDSIQDSNTSFARPSIMPEEYSRNNGTWDITIAVRRAQIELLRELPDLDLVFLAHLVSLVGFAYQVLQQVRMDSDPDFWDRSTAFQETVLRQGASVVLWGTFGPQPAGSADGAVAAARLGWLSGGWPSAGPASSTPGSASTPGSGSAAVAKGSLKDFVESMVYGTIRELREWEMGGWARSQPNPHPDSEGLNNGSDHMDTSRSGDGYLPPGLRMTIWGVMRERLCRRGWDDDANVGDWADSVVSHVVKGLGKAGVP